jgi:hypothetical protein
LRRPGRTRSIDADNGMAGLEAEALHRLRVTDSVLKATNNLSPEAS